MEKKSSGSDKLSVLSQNQDEEEKETNNPARLKELKDADDDSAKLVEKKEEEEDEEDDDEKESELIESVVDSQAVGSNEIVSAVAGTSIGVKEQNLKDNDFHLISSFYDEDEESEEELEPRGKEAHGSEQEGEEDKATESGEDEEEDLFKTPSSTQRSAGKTRHTSESEKPKKMLKFADSMPTRRLKKQQSNASMGNNEFSSEVSNFNSNEDDLMLDLADLLTVIEEVQDESSKQELDDAEKHFHLKQTVSTVLLSKKWNKLYQKEEVQSGGKKGKLPKMLKLQPTYRMTPLVNVFKMENAIKDKTQQTFESILQKYGKYDTEYTPKLLRCVTEIIKQQVKSFKLDRYKVVVHVTFIKKLAGQSVQVISKTLWSNESDLRICIRYDAYSYYAIGLIFLAYHEWEKEEE